MAMMASRKTSTCRSESPASIRCSNLRQTASYSMASGTLSSNVARPCRTARIIAAEAPVGLRMAATTASVSSTSLTSYTISHYGRYHPLLRHIVEVGRIACRTTSASPDTHHWPGTGHRHLREMGDKSAKWICTKGGVRADAKTMLHLKQGAGTTPTATRGLRRPQFDLDSGTDF